MRRAWLAALLLGLATCDLAAPPGVPASDADTCGAADHAGLVGQDATALERVLILGPVRVIRPGMAVTMDHRPDRINFSISEAGRITRIYCG
ncbi:I78 family peptidase inhibitor [Salibaculum halophilum]|uniref:I78 family peptidase inhibitor n=1 Tax=Salibaculum halophilum TaxID=1914408 RepID=UPI000A109218|nr:I78 family peptidase inhibitor [Salibaculum halophilum]